MVAGISMNFLTKLFAKEDTKHVSNSVGSSKHKANPQAPMQPTPPMEPKADLLPPPYKPMAVCEPCQAEGSTIPEKSEVCSTPPVSPLKPAIRKSPRLHKESVSIASESLTAKASYKRPLLGVRSQQELLDELLNYHAFEPFQKVTGPFASAEVAKSAINECIRPGFSVVISNTIDATNNKGSQKRFRCSLHSKQSTKYPYKCNCGFYIRMELSKEGTWVAVPPMILEHIVSQSGEQAHAVFKTQSEALLDPHNQYIPDELKPHLTTLVELGKPAYSIYMDLKKLSQLKNMKQLPFTSRYIYQNYVSKRYSHHFEAQEFYDYCMAQTEKGIYSTCALDYEGVLEKAFCMLPDGIDAYSDSRIITVDNTFGTTSFNFKLTLFVTINKFGQSQIVAYGFMLHEDTPSFTWMFQQFLSQVKQEPAVIITDQDAAMMSALTTVFASSVHLLCVWHISLNFATHLKPLLKSEGMQLFWSIALKSDVTSQSTFDEEFSLIIKLCYKYSNTSNYSKQDTSLFKIA